MVILANVLALALVAVDEPKPAKVPPTATTPTQIEAREVWQLSLPEAIRIGLDNSEVVRTLSTVPMTAAGGLAPLPSNSAVIITRLNRDASIWNFKSAMLAHVRSIEQQYWALAFSQINLWARETAVKLGGEILARERAELARGRATKANVAEAEQQFENYKLNLISANADLMTTERQLRNILGLPASDNRRIVPATAPTEAKLDPNWEESLAAMNESQPDIAQQRQMVGLAELKAVIEGDNPTVPAERRDASKLQVARQKEFLAQILHQTTHSLARFSLEIDGNYKQFQAAQRLREASQQRLEAQRVLYDEGRITIDRLLDAVTQYTNAIAQEAQFKSSYNTSIAAFEEAKGTLLNRDQIIVVDGPVERNQTSQPRDNRLVPAAFEAPVAPPAPAALPTPAPAPTQAQPASTTYKLRAKFGLMKILDVELEVCPNPK